MDDVYAKKRVRYVPQRARGKKFGVSSFHFDSRSIFAVFLHEVPLPYIDGDGQEAVFGEDGVCSAVGCLKMWLDLYRFLFTFLAI